MFVDIRTDTQSSANRRDRIETEVAQGSDPKQSGHPCGRYDPLRRKAGCTRDQRNSSNTIDAFARLTMINSNMILPHPNMQNGPGTTEFEQLLRDFEIASGQSVELEKFATLLDDFNGLPRLERRRPRTLLQIAGFPHRELAYSNILAFLLDPTEEHGMGDLVLCSLLEAAQESDIRASLPAKVVKVTREDPTEEKKRIDIMVETESFVLGIENKIFAGIVNPLPAYRDHVEVKATENGKDKLWKCILLSLHEESPDAALCGFSRITYAELFSALRKNLGVSLSSATPKHLFYLLSVSRDASLLESSVPVEVNGLAYSHSERSTHRRLAAFLLEHHTDVSFANAGGVRISVTRRVGVDQTIEPQNGDWDGRKKAQNAQDE